MPMMESATIHGSHCCVASGKDRQRESHEAVGAHLQQDRREDDRAGGRRLDVRVGQPGVEREHRHLDREAEEEAEEDPQLQRRRDEMADVVILQHAEGGRVAQSLDVEERDAAVVEEVERQDRQQHQHRAGQRVEEELDRGVQPPRPPQMPMMKYIGTSITSQKT